MSCGLAQGLWPSCAGGTVGYSNSRDLACNPGCQDLRDFLRSLDWELGRDIVRADQGQQAIAIVRVDDELRRRSLACERAEMRKGSHTCAHTEAALGRFSFKAKRNRDLVSRSSVLSRSLCFDAQPQLFTCCSCPAQSSPSRHSRSDRRTLSTSETSKNASTTSCGLVSHIFGRLHAGSQQEDARPRV